MSKLNCLLRLNHGAEGSPDFEEVPFNVFQQRDKIVTEKGDHRYADQYVVRDELTGEATISMECLTVAELTTVSRWLGIPTVGTPRHSMIQTAPRFLHIKPSGKAAVRLIDTETGKTYKQM